MNEKITCIIPTFNRAELLKIAVESILSQTYTNWELIIVDDHSIDHTAEVIQHYKNKDTRIIYTKNPRKGLPAARNHGISLATGAYIAFLDDDDISLPHRFASQLAAMKKAGCAFLVSGFRIKNINSQQIIADEKLELIAAGAGIPSRWMVKKELYERIGGFDETFACMEDNECSYRLAKHEVFTLHDDIVLIYHINPTSMSRNKEANIRGRLRLLEKHEQNMPALEAAWWYYAAGLEYYAVGHKKDAVIQFKKAAALDTRTIYRLALRYYQMTHFLGGPFKKLNLKILTVLEGYKYPPLVKHPII